MPAMLKDWRTTEGDDPMNGKRVVAVLAAFLATCAVAQASGAGFTLVGLGKPDESGDVPRYRLKGTVGQPLTLTAQGVVMPRGAAAQPGEPEAATWLFDDSAFELKAPETKGTDATKASVVLIPLKAGEHRVRFVGVILGYQKKIDVIIEVAPRK